MIKKYNCPVCKKSYVELNSLISHIEKEHEDLNIVLKEKDITIKQYLFNIRNKKEPFTKYGKSIVSSKPTIFNELAGKYNRILESEKEEYRKMFNRNMIKQYGTNNLLNDADHQKFMLSNRKISGRYNYKGKEVVYTGNLEYKFLEYLDTILNWPIEDIEIPSKEIILYKDPEDGRVRQYLPDLYIISLDLLIEVKPSLEFHYKLRDSKVESAKDEASIKSGHNYFKQYDADYSSFMLKVKELSENLEN